MNIFTLMSAGVGLFKQRFPYNSSWKSRLLTATGFGLFVLLFLWVFKPFQMDTLPNGWLVFVNSAIYACATFVCILVTNMIAPLLFPRFYTEDSWTTGKQVFQLCFVVVIVGLGNYLISGILAHTVLSWEYVFWFQGITICTALLPIIIYTLLRQNLLLRHFKQQAEVLEEKLQQKMAAEAAIQPAITTEPVNNPDALIHLTGDYQQENIVISPEKLYCIVAASNYIKVYIEQQGKPGYSIIRMTMKKAEETLIAWPVFFRCHRAWIVNLDKVQHVEGNAQGYKLQLPGIEEHIPVSRNLNTEFSDRLLAVRNRSLQSDV